MEEEPTLSH
ncbi:hypothetical protein SOVF_171030, partial [Spinacia oleracea]